MTKRQGSLLSYSFVESSQTASKRVRSPNSSAQSQASSTPEEEIQGSADDQPLTSCDRTDVGKYCEAEIVRFTNEQKYWILKHAFRPGLDFKFPSKVEYTKTRSFQHSWLREYPWLSYSISVDGGYCIHCVLFAMFRGILGQLVTSPMKIFTRATLTLKEHNTQQSHLMAMEDSASFTGIMEGRQLSVQQQLQTHGSRQIQKNHEILQSILKVIIFCGKQNISLRGHRESMSSNASQGNPGNFISLLHLRMDAGDVVLKEHFSTAARNARYHSPTVQNELVAACGEWIQEILHEVRKAKFFSVCADEAADASNKEQLPLVLRFVDEAGAIREKFIEYYLFYVNQAPLVKH